MLEDMRVRQLSPCTQQTYVETVARFARHFDRSPARLGPEAIRAYQVYLTNERRLAPSAVVVAVSALRFLYRVRLRKQWVFDDVIPVPKKPRSLPVVLSRDEVVQFLDAVKAAKHHAILTTCYAAGLRISEATHLTASAIDSQRMVLRIAQGKGKKSLRREVTGTSGSGHERRNGVEHLIDRRLGPNVEPGAAGVFSLAVRDVDDGWGGPPRQRPDVTRESDDLDVGLGVEAADCEPRSDGVRVQVELVGEGLVHHPATSMISAFPRWPC